jgi:hypothetical protein
MPFSLVHMHIYQAVWCYIPADIYSPCHFWNLVSHKFFTKDQHITDEEHKFNITPACCGQARLSSGITCKRESCNWVCSVHAVPECGPAWLKLVGGILNFWAFFMTCYALCWSLLKNYTCKHIVNIASIQDLPILFTQSTTVLLQT